MKNYKIWPGVACALMLGALAVQAENTCEEKEKCEYPGQILNPGTLNKTSDTICVGGSVTAPAVDGLDITNGWWVEYQCSDYYDGQSGTIKYRSQGPLGYDPVVQWTPSDPGTNQFTNCGSFTFTASVKGVPPPNVEGCSVLGPVAVNGSYTVTVHDCPPPGCNCSSPIPDDEWNGVVHPFWPNLQKGHTCKEANATPPPDPLPPYPYTGVAYNCMAWTLGDTSRWWWLEADSNGDGKLTVDELNAFYAAKGITGIAYYGSSASDVGHVAKKSGGPGNLCEASSKCGWLLRMSHDLHEMEGGSYYNIVGGN